LVTMCGRWLHRFEKLFLDVTFAALV
jgi:hypothetical protein